MRLFNNNSSVAGRDRIQALANILYWLLLIGGCVVFLMMNMYTTIKEDDIFHSTIGGGSTRPINTFLDVLRGWVAYYKYDARMANIISFTFNGVLGKPVFNIFNTLVFGLMAHLLSRMTTGRNSPMVLVMLFTYMVTAMPLPGETLLWPTASFNYMWALTASMLFIGYLLKHRNPRPGWLLGILVFLLSMFAGGINEGTTFGVFGGLVLYFLLNRGKVDRAVLIAMAGYMTGVLVLLTCPGAWDRASLEVSRDAGALSLLVARCRLVAGDALRFVTPAVAIIILLAALVRFGFKKTFTVTPWPLVFLVLLAFAFVVGKDQPRLYFPVSMAGFIILAITLDGLFRRAWWLRLVVVLVGLAICVRYYPYHIKTLKQYQAFFDGVETQIKQSPDAQVVLKEQIFPSYSRFIKYFNFESWNFLIREQTLCYHYGKDNIQFVPDFIYDRFHGGRLLDGAVPAPFFAPQCPDVEAVHLVPDPGYMAVQMRQDTISYSYQFAQAFQSDNVPMPYPIAYFPLLYQGHEFIIFPLIDSKVSKLVFSPYDLDGPTIDLCRIPQKTKKTTNK